jgi:hypothetical protein
MGKLSNYAENKVLDHILKVAAFTRPTKLFLALCEADPDETGTGGTITEPSDAAYTREACDTWNSAASRATSIATVITFPDCTEDWDPITHFAILDTVTLATGNIIAYGPVTPNKTFYSGNTPKVAIGDLDVSVDAGGSSDYLANKILDHLLEGTAYTPATHIYVALCTATILDNDTGTTISEPGSNYARILHDDWKISSGGASSNSDTVVFAQATSGTFGTITHFGLCDAATVGNLLCHAALNTAQPVETDDIAQWADGALDVTVD